MSGSNRWDGAVIVALGSNVPGADEGSAAVLDQACACLAAVGLTVAVRSRWWRSAAWPDASRPAFLNGVAIVHTSAGPEACLALLLGVEQAFGRARAEANAPRILDLDLIAHERTVMHSTELTLPHPRAHERLFVVGPLAEIAPEWRHPLLGRMATELAATAVVATDARPA